MLDYANIRREFEGGGSYIFCDVNVTLKLSQAKFLGMVLNLII